MKEKNAIILVCLILFVLGSVLAYYNLFHSDFNFYKSEITINGNSVHEKLYFEPDKGYHALFRNFETRISTESIPYGDGIRINNVACSEGQAYTRTFGICKLYGYDSPNNQCLGYTENNEYGCSFGYNIGFYKNKQYTIEADYELSAKNLFNVNGKNYIKFIAYSPDKHVYLKKGSNIIIKGEAVFADRYFPRDYVIIYVPYTGSVEGKNIVKLNDFEFYKSTPYFSFFFISILPASLLYFIWYYFGKEKSFADIPESLSYYPKERKAWEVAAFFAPPFKKIDDKFFSSVMLDLYHRKIIDVKITEGFLSKKTFVKINQLDNKKLDDVENNFINFLIFIRDNAKDNYKEGDYTDLSGAAKSFGLRFSVQSKFKELDKKVSEIGNSYISLAGNYLVFAAFFAFYIIYFAIFDEFSATVIYIFIILIMVFLFPLLNKTALFSRHKEQFYSEYQHWQAFKKYIEAAPSIKEGEYKAVKLWDKYMVYALALGVSKRAIKQLKDRGLISENEYNISIGFVGFSHSFSTATGASGGGAGGGGVGGGGGGGR